MRVISGKYKGRRLKAPAGRATRPTADRVKETVFNILGAGVRHRRVLDLFAGSGALGIEAISRQAMSTVFIDHDKAALRAIQRNIDDLGIHNQACVIRWNILKNLNCLTTRPQMFNLVFMDPPYGTDAVSPTLAHLADSGALADCALLVIEHSAREAVLVNKPFTTVDQRQIGKTLVTFIDAML